MRVWKNPRRTTHTPMTQFLPSFPPSLPPSLPPYLDLRHEPDDPPPHDGRASHLTAGRQEGPRGILHLFVQKLLHAQGEEEASSSPEGGREGGREGEGGKNDRMETVHLPPSLPPSLPPYLSLEEGVMSCPTREVRPARAVSMASLTTWTLES